jgi:hypothetical protein
MVAKIRFLPLMHFVAGSAFEKPSLVQLTAMAALSRNSYLERSNMLHTCSNLRFGEAALPRRELA